MRFPKQPYGLFPTNAAVGDRNAVLEGCGVAFKGLFPFIKMTLQHYAGNARMPFYALSKHVLEHQRLRCMVFAAVVVRAVHQEALREPGLCQHGAGSGNRLLPIVWALLSPAKNQGHARVAFGVGNDDAPRPIGTEESVPGAGGNHSIHCYLDAVARAASPILETHGHAEAAGKLPMRLAFSGPRSNGSPRYKVCQVLGSDMVNPFGRGREP